MQISRLEYTADGGQGLSWTYYDYTYDSAGRIATYAPSVAAKYAEQYTYDELEQLTKVTKDNKTVASYTYDTAGNILTAQNATGTHTYTYGNVDWRDLLTAYDGHAFTYEQSATGKPSGNPTTYYNGTEYGMTWKMGNQLATASKTGKSMTFSYDADGIRTSKTVASGNKTVTYNYLTQDGKVMRQEWEKDDVNYQLDFFYDTQGKPLGVIYRQNGNGLSYYYLTNQQGDVTKLYKPVAVSGSTKVNMVEIATYSYDPWGKATVTVNTGSQITNNDRTLANINPLRYRGYYQDVETGFYYLQSRYYDPVIGRFINADLPEYAALSATDITGTNLFAYCKNDPVNHADEDGEWLHLAIVAVVGGIIGAVSAAAGGGDAFSVVVAAATGAIGGLVSASGAGALAQTLVSAGLSMASNAATQIHGINSGVQKKFNYGDMILDGVVSGVTGARGGAGASHGNTGGIKAATKQMFKRIHKGDGIRKAYAYYAKTAHAKGGTFVLHGLRDSLRKTAKVGVFSAAKSRINSWRSRRLQ
jgi:RHS repeat-associated protein